MYYNRSPLKIIGRYAASYTIIGLALGISVLTVRSTYKEIIHPSYISSISSQEQKQENELYGKVFLIGGIAGIIAGTTIGIKRSSSLKEQDREHEACPHCHYHF